MARLTLGELYLKQAVAQRAAGHESAGRGAGAVRSVSGHVHRDSPLAGKAYLDQGWCLWMRAKYPESLAAFKTAAQLLPPSVDLAVARFKMGDALFAQGDFAGARDNYEAVWQDFTNFPAVNTDPCPPGALSNGARVHEIGRHGRHHQRAGANPDGLSDEQSGR